MTRLIILSTLLAITLSVSPGSAQESAAVRYRSMEQAETVEFVDTDGVHTIATGFGKLFGMSYLTARRGQTQVEIPFARMSRLRMGTIVDHRLPVEIELRSGRTLSVTVDRSEFQTLYGGTAEFGYFRIRFEQIKELIFDRAEISGDGEGQRCSHGHIYYNDTWKYCPYDGERLTPIQATK
jgi:hypothetical protein